MTRDLRLLALPVVLLLAVMLLQACTSKSDGPAPERSDEVTDTSAEEASAAALDAYEALYDGETAHFLDCCAHSSKFTGDYRDQMLLNYRRHVEHVDTTRNGVKAVSVTRAERDESLQLIEVCLQLEYGNGTTEEIVVPMINIEGKWKIK